MKEVKPKRLLVLVRPVGSDDLAIMLDGRRLEPDEMPYARAFVGDWRMSSRPVTGYSLEISVGRDATLIEVATAERDDAGRIEPVAIWFANGVSPDQALDEASASVAQAGRTFDLAEARRTLRSAERRIGKARRLQGFLALLARLIKWIQSTRTSGSGAMQ